MMAACMHLCQPAGCICRPQPSELSTDGVFIGGTTLIKLLLEKQDEISGLKNTGVPADEGRFASMQILLGRLNMSKASTYSQFTPPLDSWAAG